MNFSNFSLIIILIATIGEAIPEQRKLNLRKIIRLIANNAGQKKPRSPIPTRRKYIIKCCGFKRCMGNATRHQSTIASIISVTNNNNHDDVSASFPGTAVEPTGSSADNESQDGYPSSTNVNAGLSGGDEDIGADSFISEGTGSTAFQESGSAMTSTSKTSLVGRTSGDATAGLDTNLSSLAKDIPNSTNYNNKEMTPQSATTIGLNSGLSSTPAFSNINAVAETTTSIKSIENSVTTANPINNAASGIVSRTDSTAVASGTSQSTKLGPSTTAVPASTTTPSCHEKCAVFNNYLSQRTSSQPAGSVQTATLCSRQYFVSTSSVVRNEAALGCQALSMTLLTTTSLEELNCLANSFKGTFWTGGSREGIDCNGEIQNAWCSTGHLISPSLLSMAKFWLSTNAMAFTVEKCLALTILDSSNKGMVHKKCDDLLPFVCQFSTDCPQQCDKNPLLFDSTGNLKNKTSYGIWIDIGNTTYLLGNKPMTWLNSWNQCCALGMEMLNIDNADEQRDLSSLTVGQTKKTWKANFNYWTSGTWKGAPAGQWSWCETTGPTVPDKNLIWERGQPDNKGGNESCIHFRFVLNSTGAVLTDRNCDSKFLYACKTSLLSTNAKPCIASCPPINTCQRNRLLFSTNLTIHNYTSYGEWYDACGRTILMYTKTKLNWTNAWKQCCAVGLNLTSTESAGKFNCFSRIVSKFAPKTYGDFWLAGTDVGCPSSFRWCPLNRNFIDPELRWKEGHPKDGLDCVYLEARNGSVLLATANCTEQKFFFCDLIKVASSPNRAIQNECADIWEITTEQIDNLLISSFFDSLNITQNLRCFLKCMGVNVGMFELGGVNGIDLLRQIELASEEDPVQMQNGFGAYDTCSGKKFDDECVTAEEIYKCGLKEAPDLVAKIVNNNNINESMMIPPLPCVPKLRSCWLSNLYPCVTNQTAIDAINNSINNTDEIGKLFNETGKPFYVGRAKTTGIDVVAAFQHCCALGMKLFEPKTLLALMFVFGNSMPDEYRTSGAYLVGDSETINQTHEVWCGSRTVFENNVFSTEEKFPCTESIIGVVSTLSFVLKSRSNENIHNLYINRANIDDFASFICEKV
ncbi:Hypothetical predicted protein [Cloeon dipterum]|uniref:C-type lectin domain-containing protein n=1 Tax=Cloeon dipterum TaxID=197152 RepID=A0A8S1EBE4_9INSE|nr:Hypothetical predicted protein [Cloeon dipterum]